MGLLELATLVILAVLLFDPDRLSEIIQNAAGFLRKVREFSEDARQEIRSGLGPELQDFEFEDLHPKNFVRKHLLDADDGLGLDEVRNALDPRAEFGQVARAVSDVAGRVEEGAVLPVGVNPAKGELAEPAAHHPFDPDPYRDPDPDPDFDSEAT
ncbi:Sec-independent protein translocase subunit TatB [Streptomyces hyderabadensis]|uniref:Sec-independent protein translocase subunit TatB n=1 Tax=Streptomyces hyderabadensis TaxID=598549 RepID=UPI001CF09280|nr:Sec-independent protein translocase subunit TatB [Streptomyces hyderabadensis]